MSLTRLTTGGATLLQIAQVAGVPSNTPTGTQPIVSIDTTTGVLYTWDGGTWLAVGYETIYTSNGVLTTNRIVDGDGKHLEFSDINNFTIQGNNFLVTANVLFTSTNFEIVGEVEISGNSFQLTTPDVLIDVSLGEMVLKTAEVLAGDVVAGSLLVSNDINGTLQFTPYNIPLTLGTDGQMLVVDTGELVWQTYANDNLFSADLVLDANRDHDLAGYVFNMYDSVGTSEISLGISGASNLVLDSTKAYLNGFGAEFHVSSLGAKIIGVITVTTAPSLDNALTDVLVRDSGTGILKYRTIASIPGTYTFNIIDSFANSQAIASGNNVTFTQNTNVADVLRLTVSATDTVTLGLNTSGASSGQALVYNGTKLVYQTLPTVNLYTGNGTVTSNRTVNLDSKNLTFSNGGTVLTTASSIELSATTEVKLESSLLVGIYGIIIFSISSSYTIVTGNLLLNTAAVTATTATNGQVLTLINASNGECEWVDPTGDTDFDITDGTTTVTIEQEDVILFTPADLMIFTISAGEVALSWDEDTLVQGDILTFDGSNMVNLALGSPGQVLSVNPFTTGVYWRTISGGSFSGFTIIGDDSVDQEIGDSGIITFEGLTHIKLNVEATAVVKLELDGLSTGDILFYNATDLDRLAIGSTYDVLEVVAGEPTWVSPQGFSAYRFMFDDFYNTSIGGMFRGAAINTGAVADIASGDVAPEHPGAVLLRASASANSGYYIMSQTSILGGNGWFFRCVFKLKSHTATTLRMGFHDSFSVTTPVDGVYAQVVSGVLKFHTISNSSPTEEASTHTMVVDTWYTIDIHFTGASEITFTIKNDAGTVLDTKIITATIPSTGARAYYAGALATFATGGISDIAVIDYIGFGPIKPKYFNY